MLQNRLLINQNNKYIQTPVRFAGNALCCNTATIEVKPHEEKAYDKLSNSQKLRNSDKRFNQKEIATILQHYQPEKQAILDCLLNAKNIDNKRNRFNAENITNLMRASAPENKVCLETILAAKTPDGKNHRFEAKEIGEIIYASSPEKQEVLKTLLNAKTLNNKDRFNYIAIATTLRACPPEKQEVLDTLLNAKTIDNKDHRFNANDIQQVLKNSIPENNKILEQLIEAKNINNNKFRFNSNDISKITNSALPNSKNALNILLNSKTIDNKKHRFNAEEISNILNSEPEKKEEVLKNLLNTKATDNKSFRFDNNEIAALIYNYNPKSKTLFNKLINEKDTDNQYKYSGKQAAQKLKTYNTYNFLLDKKKLKQLDSKENKKLLHLICYNPNLGTELNEFEKDGFNSKLITKVETKNKAELVGKIINNIKNSIKVNPLSPETIDKFNTSIEKIDNHIANFDFDNEKLKLSYPRDKFIKDLSDSIEPLNETEQKEVFKNYNFSLEDSNNGKTLVGYPAVLKNNSKKPDLPAEKQKEIEGIIKKFTSDNKITLPEKYKPLEKDLNSITEAFPEFLTTIGKKQHKTQKYTLDLHELKVLKEFTQHPEYKNLSDKDKKLGKISILLHDISKKEGIVDRSHPIQSSIDVYPMIKKLNMSSFDNDRITGLIRNHHWSQQLSENTKSVKDMAFEFRKPGDFEISRIFAEADLKAVNNDFYKSFLPNLKSNINKVQPIIDNINSTGIWLPRTKLPKASELGTKYVKKAEGMPEGKLKVIDIQDFNEFYGIIHAIDADDFSKQHAKMFDYTSDEGNEGVFSVSYINKDNFHTYGHKKYGFVMDVDPANIAAASKNNLFSGDKKGTDSFKNYLFDKEATGRTRFSDSLKRNLQKVGYTMDYKSLYKKLEPEQDLENIRKNDPKLYTAINSTIKNAILNSEKYNELVVYAPKPVGIFAKDKIEKMPKALQEYAEEKDLPVLKIH